MTSHVEVAIAVIIWDVVGRVSPPRIALLLVRFIHGLSIDVGDKGQSGVGEVRVR